MDMTNESCRKFVEVLASNAPTPGGGGAAALVGAVGTALGNMVGSLTVGKKKYADVEEEILALKAKCDALQTELLDQVAADAVGFEPLAKAYGIPKADAMAFGDGNNDLEMFGAVGTCVAMANGSADLKAAATHLCGSCAEDGIYHFCADNGLI